MPLRETLSGAWDHIQGELFPMLREEVGPLTGKHRQLVTVSLRWRVQRCLCELGPVCLAVRSRTGMRLPVPSLLRPCSASDNLGANRAARRRILPSRRLCGWERRRPECHESTMLTRLRRVCRHGAARTMPTRPSSQGDARGRIVGPHLRAIRWPSKRREAGEGLSYRQRPERGDQPAGERRGGAEQSAAPVSSVDGRDVCPSLTRSADLLHCRYGTVGTKRNAKGQYGKLDGLQAWHRHRPTATSR